MSKKTKTIYKCDICGGEFIEEGSLSEIKIPYQFKLEVDRVPREREGLFDACTSCKSMYKKIIYEHFAVITKMPGAIKTDIKFL